MNLVGPASAQFDKRESGGSFGTLHVHIGLHNNRHFARCLIVRADRVNLIPENLRSPRAGHLLLCDHKVQCNQSAREVTEELSGAVKFVS